MQDYEAKRARYNSFIKTDLGQAFLKFDNAVINYWRMHNDDSISDKRLRELADKERQAREEFLAILMKDMGV
jgi:hypothetical protein